MTNDGSVCPLVILSHHFTKKAHKTNLNPSPLRYWIACNKPRKVSCHVFVLEISSVPLSTILVLYFVFRIKCTMNIMLGCLDKKLLALGLTVCLYVFVVSGRLHNNSKNQNSCYWNCYRMSHNGILNHTSEMHRIFVWFWKKAMKT